MGKQVLAEFDWRELDEKVLRMVVLDHEGHILVAGRDDSTGKIYIIHEENLNKQF